jgi:hypothetical protein
MHSLIELSGTALLALCIDNVKEVKALIRLIAEYEQVNKLRSLSL